MNIPHFQWRCAIEATPESLGSFDIQIAADSEFARRLDEDRIAAVIQRYVPDQELGPGHYWWRVAAVDGQGTRGIWSSVRQFSVRPPERVFEIGRLATFAEIQKVLREAAVHAPALVRFEKADYRLDPGDAEAFLDFSLADDLTVDGGGGTFTFSGLLKFVRLDRCRRVVVRDFTFDCDPLPYTAGHVLAVDVTAGTFELEIAPGHPLPESHRRFDEDRKGMIVDPSGPRIKQGVQLVLEHDGWQKLGGRRYRFAANPRRLDDLAPGDVYVMDPRIATGFDVDACNEVVFYNLTAHAIANEGFNSHYSNRLSILHCGIRLKPGRFIAANNGGHNHHNARVGPWIEGGIWENTGDDICHVNCLVMGVEEQLAPNRVRLPLNNPYDRVGRTVGLDVRPGDELLFYNRAEGRLIGRRNVLQTMQNDRSLEVILDGDVGDIVPGRPGVTRLGTGKVVGDTAITQVFNADRACNEFVFRHNMVRNARRIGVLAKGRGGLIENNTFHELGGGAVELWNAPFEGLGAAHYVVRDNRILDCGLLDRTHAAIWTTMFATGGDRLHRNLLIAGNEIRNFRGTPILLRDVENCLVRDNRILVTGDNGPQRNQASEPIVLSNTQDVRLQRDPLEDFAR